MPHTRPDTNLAGLKQATRTNANELYWNRTGFCVLRYVWDMWQCVKTWSIERFSEWWEGTVSKFWSQLVSWNHNFLQNLLPQCGKGRWGTLEEERVKRLEQCKLTEETEPLNFQTLQPCSYWKCLESEWMNIFVHCFGNRTHLLVDGKKFAHFITHSMIRWATNKWRSVCCV